jgi:hypothetical protein
MFYSLSEVRSMSREAEYAWQEMYSITADRIEMLYNAGRENFATRMERDAEVELERLWAEANDRKARY